ncbi:MAG: zinc ribbon domain-containing protein [Chloroflexota bacterium]
MLYAGRVWTCPGCAARQDRDVNAALNIAQQPTVGATARQRLGRDGKTAQPLASRPSSHPFNPRSPPAAD